MKKLLLIIAIALSLAGCGSPAPTAAAPAPAPTPGGPTVAYVTFTNIQPVGGTTYDVRLDTLLIHRLAPGQSWLYNATPGAHTVDWCVTTGPIAKTTAVSYIAGNSYTETSP